MATFGMATVLGWDLDALAALGTDLGRHGQDLRRCFADFRGSTDLSENWRGTAADAATHHANDLALDLYELSDTIGLLSQQIGRRQADLVQARDTLVKTRNVAHDNGLLVGDDGEVSVGPPLPGEPRSAGDNTELLSEAARLSATLKAAINDAAEADIDIARALQNALTTVTARAQDRDTLVQAVDYIGQPSVVDPFLADAHFLGPEYPRPGDPDFATYWASLTTDEQLLVRQNWGKVPGDVDPFKGVQGGDLVLWAQQYNTAHGVGRDGAEIRPGYGYLGGGSVTGPDGSQWPIVSPYYSDGKHVFFSDSGEPRTDGGINEFDGRDPGWTTVDNYVGPGGFGTVSASTTSIIIGENLGGQELEVHPVDSEGVSIGSNGQPVYHGPDDQGSARPPDDKPYWDVQAPEKKEPFNNEEAAKAAISLGIQGGDGVVQAEAAGTHDQREYSIAYQVNDDGRVRAVVNTYTSGPNEEGGGVNVGGFATSFPDGSHGAAMEVPIDVRENTPGGFVSPTASAAGVHFLGDENRGGELIENTRIMREKLDR